MRSRLTDKFSLNVSNRFIVISGFFSGGKTAGACDHLPPSGVEVETEWSCTSVSSLHRHGMCRTSLSTGYIYIYLLVFCLNYIIYFPICI